MTNEERRANMDRIRAEAEADLKQRGVWDKAVVVGEAIDNGTFTEDMLDDFTISPDADPEN